MRIGRGDRASSLPARTPARGAGGHGQPKAQIDEEPTGPAPDRLSKVTPTPRTAATNAARGVLPKLDRAIVSQRLDDSRVLHHARSL
jgi:hypothetical protein